MNYIYLARAILRHPDRDEEILGAFLTDEAARAACEAHASKAFFTLWVPSQSLNRSHYDYDSVEVPLHGSHP